MSEGNTPKCPKCRRVIPGDDINVANDVAYCRSCNIGHTFSELVQNSSLQEEVDFHQPPSGVQCAMAGDEIKIWATHRSTGAAIVTLFFALFWNGIVSVFVLVAVASTLGHLGILVPDWFPAPEMNGNPMGVGMTIFLWLFLTPLYRSWSVDDRYISPVYRWPNEGSAWMERWNCFYRDWAGGLPSAFYQVAGCRCAN